MGEEKKKPQFEPMVPLGIFLSFFGLVIIYATRIPEDFIDKMVNLISGLAFLVWGLGWFLVGWRRRKKNQ